MSHAIVFGASGLAGWGVVNELLEGYPEKGTFNQVTALCNRPMSFEQAFWPNPQKHNMTVNVVSGIDLTQTDSQTVIDSVAQKIPDIGSVTHAFYFAYKPEQDLKEEQTTNGRMLQNAVDALTSLSPKLQFISLLTGAKAYGVTVEQPEPSCKAPWDETMSLPEPYKSDLFYTKYRQILTDASKGQQWTWCDLRPGLIVGFDPNGSPFSAAAHWGRYLTTYALVRGPGAKVPFPGFEAGYQALSNEASSEIIAKAAIWASLHPEKCGQGEAFNVANTATPLDYVERWSSLCKYFGLESISPAEAGISKMEDIELPSVYVQKHKDAWANTNVKLDVDSSSGPQLMDYLGIFLTFDATLDTSKIKKAGFTEELDPVQSWYKAWDKFRSAGMLPVL